MTSDTIEFSLKQDHIALCDLLKATGIAESGGQGKEMVTRGEVQVDGQVEIRKAAMIRAGQRITVARTVILVTGQTKD